MGINLGLIMYNKRGKKIYPRKQNPNSPHEMESRFSPATR
jgi:hypothetical protein